MYLVYVMQKMAFKSSICFEYSLQRKMSGTKTGGTRIVSTLEYWYGCHVCVIDGCKLKKY